MANTFIKIQTVTVGSGGTSSIDFTSIPSTYTDLCLKLSLRGNAASGGGGQFHNQSVTVKVNSSSTNYSVKSLFALYDSGGYQTLFGTGTSIDFTINNNGGTSNTFASSELYFTNYASSSNKSILIDSVEENNISTSNLYSWWLQILGALWSDTSAITSISITPNAGSFVQYSTATLYGIKKS
jgi:hypothetical protein